MKYLVGGSARRHRIGNAHIIAALESDDLVVDEVQEGGAVFVIATDDRGVELHIGYRPAREEDAVFVFHCLPTRYYREGG